MSCIDVVIPCYNYARYLPQAVTSVLEQEGVDVRVLIIDDCSADDTEKVGRQFAEKDHRVEFRRHQINRGHIATYNEGLLGWATSDYSVLLSADDALAKGALARAAQVLDRHPEAVMTCGMGRVLWDDDNYSNKVEISSSEYRIVPGSHFLERCFLLGNQVCNPTAMVRTSLQQQLGGYRTDLPHSGDTEMWMRFAVHGSVGLIKDVQAYYRIHSSNMSSGYYSQLLGDIREVVQAFEQIISQWGAQLPKSIQWRDMMLQRMGNECCWLASLSFDKGDKEGYVTCLEFAEQLFPEIRDSYTWRKVQAKSIMGQTIWQIVRPMWEHFRELRRLLSGHKNLPRFYADQLSGWWPESRES